MTTFRLVPSDTHIIIILKDQIYSLMKEFPYNSLSESGNGQRLRSQNVKSAMKSILATSILYQKRNCIKEFRLTSNLLITTRWMNACFWRKNNFDTKNGFSNHENMFYEEILDEKNLLMGLIINITSPITTYQ